MSTTTDIKPGTRMPDGTIHAGISPETGKPFYVTPKDAPLTCTFDQAARYAEKLDAHGHSDWRVPTKAELNVLFQNRGAIGVDTTGSNPTGWYWSSSRFGYYFACAQRFSDGIQYSTSRDYASALRCVRG